ncbi:3'(2'),5'-bisphosphate nucleotidase CysQ [Frigidibacter oleivorans]|uniref:3'(2'),5'-bisphosphate nucleotidase CysQ n=1 Tax=Frigidibacter oleivorans TaxID=2487129 RepID=UPI002E26A1A9
MPAPDDPGRDLQLLLDAAEAAGRLAMTYWRLSPEAWEKAGGAGPVTVADLAVDRMLRADLRAARPDYGWLSEETEDDPAARLAAERLFIVDPIDGTRAFIAGEDGFAVALATVEAGAVTAAVIHLPARGETYAAAAGGPATLNGAPIAASAAEHPEGARLLAPHQALDPVHWRGGAAPGFRRSFRPALAWRLALMAGGRHDAVLSFRPIWEWDMAAGDLIARAAGATVTDRLGLVHRYNSPGARAQGLVAAAPRLHAELMDRLVPVTELPG